MGGTNDPGRVDGASKGSKSSKSDVYWGVFTGAEDSAGGSRLTVTMMKMLMEVYLIYDFSALI